MGSITKIINDDIEIQTKELLAWEIKANEYYAKDQQKQGDYCESKVKDCFNALKVLIKKIDKSTNEIDAWGVVDYFSEMYHDQIKKKALKLDENHGVEY